jgi:hypothetical protein
VNEQTDVNRFDMRKGNRREGNSRSEIGNIRKRRGLRMMISRMQLREAVRRSSRIPAFGHACCRSPAVIDGNTNDSPVKSPEDRN